MLKGWKTYIVMALGVITNGLIAMNFIPESAMGFINAILGYLGLGAIRAGVKKAEKAANGKE